MGEVPGAMPLGEEPPPPSMQSMGQSPGAVAVPPGTSRPILQIQPMWALPMQRSGSPQPQRNQGPFAAFQPGPAPSNSAGLVQAAPVCNPLLQGLDPMAMRSMPGRSAMLEAAPGASGCASARASVISCGCCDPVPGPQGVSCASVEGMPSAMPSMPYDFHRQQLAMAGGVEAAKQQAHSGAAFEAHQRHLFAMQADLTAAQHSQQLAYHTMLSQQMHQQQRSQGAQQQALRGGQQALRGWQGAEQWRQFGAWPAPMSTVEAAPAKPKRRAKPQAEGEEGAAAPPKRARPKPKSALREATRIPGGFPCPNCERVFDSKTSLSGHGRYCTGGNWECEWCACKETETPSKSTGPNGPKTLCNACGSRFRAGHMSMPQKNEAGKYLCPDCGRPFATIGALGGHRRFCDSGNWRCKWCECKADECSGKGPGPEGPKTLCSACSSRFRNGHTGPTLPNEEGKYVCDLCARQFETIGALGGHRRFCDSGNWRCKWCECKADECSGKGPGPEGPKTLCSACSSRFRNGHTGPTLPNEEGKYVCDLCARQFETIGALGGHRRFCDSGNWRCKWCECKADECSGKGPGPEGPKTLCSACSARFRAGHTAAPLRDASGNFLCDCCHRAFSSMGALGGHRRFCSQLSTAIAPRVQLREDMELTEADGGADAVALPTRPASQLPREVISSLLSSYDFARYHFLAIVPAATMTTVSVSLLDREAEGEPLLPPPEVQSQRDSLAARGGVKAASTARSSGRGKKGRGARKEGVAVEDISEGVRQMLALIQAAEWEDWDGMLAAERGEQSPPFLHAFFVLSTRLICAEMIHPGLVSAGEDFCAGLAAANGKLGDPRLINCHTWPEILRMILIARSVAQAPKKRAVALDAMMSLGCADNAVAVAVAAALGGGHSVSVWSAGGGSPAPPGGAAESEAVLDEDDVEAEAELSEGGGGEWSAVCEALAGAREWSEIGLELRVQVLEAVVQLLTETSLCSRFFEVSARALEKLQDLKRSEYKKRNAQIEAEEQAKLAAKYSTDPPSKSLDDRTESPSPNPTANSPTADPPTADEGADPVVETVETERVEGAAPLPAAKKVAAKRGDLDEMRGRKDELRKQLDADFAVLQARVGRLRQPPLGTDRDRREYYLLGGPPEGEQPLADGSRLLVHTRAPAGGGKLSHVHFFLRARAALAFFPACISAYPRILGLIFRSGRMGVPALARRAARTDRLAAPRRGKGVPLAQGARGAPAAIRSGDGRGDGQRARRRWDRRGGGCLRHSRGESW